MNGFRRLAFILAVSTLAGCAKGTLLGGKNKSKSSNKLDQCVIDQESRMSVASFDHSNDAYIVKFKEDRQFVASEALGLLADGRELESLGGQFYKVSGLKGDFEQLAKLAESEAVEYLEPDYPIFINEYESSDPMINKQWAHKNVRSKEAWTVSPGAAEVVVAVIDSGVDIHHEDLAANIWRNPREILNGLDDDRNGYVDDIQGWDFARHDSDPSPDYEHSHHGTHVSGTIAAVGQNGVGITGHAPGVKIMPLRFITGSGSGRTSNAIRAIRYAVLNGATIINNSWGSYNYSQALADAIEMADRADVLFVAAAGNEGNDNDASQFYPASYPFKNVISVAATSNTNRIVSFSNYGVKEVDVAAPGHNIYSTTPGDTYKSLSGTSMAAPLVAGIAATLYSVNSELRPSGVKDILFKTSQRYASMKSKVGSGGLVDAFRAVTMAKAQAQSTTPNPQPDPASGVCP